jgi:hypothetical protein
MVIARFRAIECLSWHLIMSEEEEPTGGNAEFGEYCVSPSNSQPNSIIEVPKPRSQKAANVKSLVGSK